MLTLTVVCHGKTDRDLELAIKEAARKVEDGYLAGQDSNDTGSYHFYISGESEEEEDDDDSTD